jgi:hypothetical protein
MMLLGVDQLDAILRTCLWLAVKEVGSMEKSCIRVKCELTHPESDRYIKV